MVVLPGSALGVWTPTIARLWTRALEALDVTVMDGAVIVDETGYDNVMLKLTGQGASIRYRERMPVPVSMWQPWRSLIGKPAGVRANLFGNPVAMVHGARVATALVISSIAAEDAAGYIYTTLNGESTNMVVAFDQDENGALSNERA